MGTEPTVADAQRSLAQVLQDPNNAVVLFDGVCNLCNRAVDFLIRRNNQRNIYFLPLQDPQAQEALAGKTVPADFLSTILVLEENRVYVRSTAVLRLLPKLRGGWPALYALIIIPRFLRDAVYKLVARYRYRWFGKRDTCRLPTPEERALFL
ncbi:MAG: DCC1-like thiol-disulfide oxidoreductase family protein [Bacteroidota bacterium]